MRQTLSSIRPFHNLRDSEMMVVDRFKPTSYLKDGDKTPFWKKQKKMGPKKTVVKQPYRCKKCGQPKRGHKCLS